MQYHSIHNGVDHIIEQTFHGAEFSYWTSSEQAVTLFPAL